MEYRRDLTDSERELLRTDPEHLIEKLKKEAVNYAIDDFERKSSENPRLGTQLYSEYMELSEYEVSVKIRNLSSHPQQPKNEVEVIGPDKRTGGYRLLLHFPGKNKSDVRLEMGGGYLWIHTDDYKGSVRVGRGFFDARKRDAEDGLIEVVLS